MTSEKLKIGLRSIHIIHTSRKFLGKNTLAINLFGIILATDELSLEDINHELIHTAQMKEMLCVFFYLWYGIEWFILLLKYHNSLQAYLHISFEKEAYLHEKDLNYLENRKHFAEFFKD